MDLTPEEFIKKHNLDGIIYGSERMRYGVLPIEITEDAKMNNLVIAYGASDDLCEVRGALWHEYDCFDGGEIIIRNQKIKVIWHNDREYVWSYETDIPHACFWIYDTDHDKYCRAIVFSLTDPIFSFAPLPCPICGKDVGLYYISEDERHAYPKISCSYCNLSMRGNTYYTNVDGEDEEKEQSARILINNWNDRRKKI